MVHFKVQVTALAITPQDAWPASHKHFAQPQYQMQTLEGE